MQQNKWYLGDPTDTTGVNFFYKQKNVGDL